MDPESLKEKGERQSCSEGCALLASVVSDFCDPWTVARQPPPPMEFSGQEYWGMLPFPSPGDPTHPGIESASLRSATLASRPFTTSATKYKPIGWQGSLKNKRSSCIKWMMVSRVAERAKEYKGGKIGDLRRVWRVFHHEFSLFAKNMITKMTYFMESLSLCPLRMLYDFISQ